MILSKNHQSPKFTPHQYFILYGSSVRYDLNTIYLISSTVEIGCIGGNGSSGSLLWVLIKHHWHVSGAENLGGGAEGQLSLHFARWEQSPSTFTTFNRLLLSNSN